jgi:hypothetical protein
LQIQEQVVAEIEVFGVIAVNAKAPLAPSGNCPKTVVLQRAAA